MSADRTLSPAVLSCHGLVKEYGSARVVDVERLTVARGETFAVLGPSGSGKSTLLRLLGLLERPDEGRIEFDGSEVSTRSRAARLQMPLVFQDPFLFRGTVAENVGYGLRLRRVPAAAAADRIGDALETVGLGGRGETAARRLSGGEAQRVALARALVLQPRVLLLDEPLASLDAPLRRRLAAEFAAIIGGTGTTAVWVTHDQDEAAVVADRAAVLRDGRIAIEGGIDDVLGLPVDDWVAAFVGVEPPAAGTVVSADDGLVRVDCGGTIVEAVGEVAPGTRVSVGIRPEDVTLVEASDAPPASSARNRIDAVVTDVTPRGATSMVSIEAPGLRLASTVSRASVSELALAPGAPIVASFKATAIRLTTAHERVEVRQ